MRKTRRLAVKICQFRPVDAVIQLNYAATITPQDFEKYPQSFLLKLFVSKSLKRPPLELFM
jgi:hypothetical protein